MEPARRGEVFGLERQEALRRLASQEQRLWDQLSCDGDNQCVATRFHGCCADYFSESCGWHPMNAVWLQRSMDSCAEEECADGASPCFQSNVESPPEVYCSVFEHDGLVDAVCRLRGPLK